MSLAILVAVLVVLARDARAMLAACTAADITAQDNQCPAGAQPCTISEVFAVGDGCVLDFGPRPVRIVASGEIGIGSGSVVLKAASLTLAPGSRIEGRGTGASVPLSRGGMITIETTGAVTLEKGSSRSGTIDVSANDQGGVVLIRADGTVTIAGRVTSDQLTTSGAGGTVAIRARGDIVTLAGSTLSATGGIGGGGGNVDLSATGRVALGDAIMVSGGSGGSLDVTAGADVVAGVVDASGGGVGGSGGCVVISAGTQMQLLGSITANGTASLISGGGCGGSICAEARFGDLVVKDAVRAEGAAPDGGGGDLDLSARGSLRVEAPAMVSVRSEGQQGCGGELGLDAGLDITVIGRLDGSGGLGANSLEVSAGRDVVLSGPVRADGRGVGGFGGSASVTAGALTSGLLSISNSFDVSGGGCGALLGCGLGGTSDLSACVVTVSATGQLLARGASGGENAISARDQLTLAGRMDATSSIAGGPAGSNRIAHRPGHLPQQTGTVTPAAMLDPQVACTSLGQFRCLVPCPTCGDGLQEFPETCDTPGPPRSCDGCSVFCRPENPTCTDGDPCTLDRCSPAFGCDNLLITPCTTLPSTTTTTTRASTSSTTTTTTATSTTSSSTRPTSTTTTFNTTSTSTSTSTRLPSTTTSSTRPSSTTTTSSTTSTSSTSTRPPSTTTSSTRPTSTSTTSSSSTTTSSSSTSSSTSTSSTTSLPATTSTTPPPTTSTSTTLPPPPCGPLDCDDANPCTDDACTPQGCRHDAVPAGIPSATCVYEGSMLRPPVCGALLPAAVTRPFDQARGLIERSGSASNPRKARAFVRKAVKALRKGGKGIAKAMKKHAIAPECAVELSRGQAEALRRAQALL